MFVTSTQKPSMNGQQQNAESERQHLLDRLLDAVKQCQVRFGGKTELATDGDSRVVCLLTQLEAVFQHGFRRTRVSAFRQVGQVAGIVKLDSESVFWSFVKVHLGKLEEERFLSLQKATTDAGRGRAWLRSSLNEHSLERTFHHMLGNKSLLSQFYEKEAFLLDEERASMLPMIAAGLSSILFALTVDSEELNIVRQQPPPLTINKEVLTSILPSFPQKHVVEPSPVYSAVLTDESKQEKKKKKKKKKRNAAIVSIEEGDSLQDVTNDAKDFPLNDSSVTETLNSNSESTSLSLGHTRSSSYPGNITVVSEGSAAKSSCVNGQEIVFTEITKSISLPDNSVALENTTESKPTKGKSSSFDLEDFLQNVIVEPRYDTVGEAVEEAPTEKDTENFVFGSANLFLKRLQADQEKTNCWQSQNNSETLSATSSGSEITGDAVHLVQESSKIKETEKENDSGSERFEANFSSTMVSQCSKDGNEDLSQRKPNLDSCHVYSVKEDEEKESLTNFSITQMQSPKALEERAIDHGMEALSESLDPNPINLTNRQISPVDAQEHQDYRASPSEDTSQRERLAETEELHENTSNELEDFELARSRESQLGANDGKVEPVVLLDSGEFLVPVAEGDMTSKTGAQSTFYYAPDVSSENDRDSMSSTSWSYVEDAEDLSQHKDDSLLNTSARSVAMVSDASTAAALAACSDAQRGMDHMASAFISMEGTAGDQSVRRDYSKKHDSMSTGELKQAIVSMMLKKDEIEEQNRILQRQLDEERQKSQQLDTKNEQLREEIKQKENFNAARIASLSRENEVLKHQLKKYVGAVQALRSGQQSKSSETAEVLSGIRQDEILPPLPQEQATEQAQLSEEAEEYKRKLIQVADLHGELLEFNERLHKQVNYYQFQVRRLREELVNLRGPLPEDAESPDDDTSLLDFDPAVMSVGTRPLVNVWIPSVFLRGRSSSVHHVYQVYVRIKDDEWNIYRRYSQFFEMHKTLRRKFHVVDSFKFPPKKTLGNKDSQFVEDRRRLLQDYLRRVVNLYVTTDRGLRDNTTKAALLQVLPFFAEPFPPEKAKRDSSSRRKRSVNYTGL